MLLLSVGGGSIRPLTRPLQVPSAGRVRGGSADFPQGLLWQDPGVEAEGWTPAWCLHCTWGVCFSVVFDWSRAVVCFHCPFHLLWLETAGFWGLCLFVPTGVSGLLASLAASVGHMKQTKTWKPPACCSLGPEVPSQSAAFSSPLSIFMFLSNIKSRDSSCAS